ncbi:MAG: hypothetical protein ACPGJV_10005 [Bacteriovoracaceae bacterium]
MEKIQHAKEKITLLLLLSLGLLTSCGQTNNLEGEKSRFLDGSIVNGIEDKDGEFKQVMAVVSKNEGSDQYAMFCSGTPVLEKTFATAAHCFEGTILDHFKAKRKKDFKNWYFSFKSTIRANIDKELNNILKTNTLKVGVYKGNNLDFGKVIPNEESTVRIAKEIVIHSKRKELLRKFLYALYDVMDKKDYQKYFVGKILTDGTNEYYACKGESYALYLEPKYKTEEEKEAPAVNYYYDLKSENGKKFLESAERKDVKTISQFEAALLCEQSHTPDIAWLKFESSFEKSEIIPRISRDEYKKLDAYPAVFAVGYGQDLTYEEIRYRHYAAQLMKDPSLANFEYNGTRRVGFMNFVKSDELSKLKMLSSAKHTFEKGSLKALMLKTNEFLHAVGPGDSGGPVFTMVNVNAGTEKAPKYELRNLGVMTAAFVSILNNFNGIVVPLEKESRKGAGGLLLGYFTTHVNHKY